MIENHFYLECYCGNLLKHKKEIEFLQPPNNMTYVVFGLREGLLYMFLRIESDLAPTVVIIEMPSARYEQLTSAVIPIFNKP